MDSIILYSFIFWPTYIVGVILIVLSIKKLRGKKNKLEEVVKNNLHLKILML